MEVSMVFLFLSIGFIVGANFGVIIMAIFSATKNH